MDSDGIFRLFRAVYRQSIPDAAIYELVRLCLASMPPCIIISEWFLFEELRPIKRKNKKLLSKTFYLMSSDDKKQYFIGRTEERRRPASHIGFAAIASPANIRIAVRL